ALRRAAALPHRRGASPPGARGRGPAHHGRHRLPPGSRGAMTKAWSGRFDAGAHPSAERFTASLAFDRRLWPYDIQGSLAWARALARAAILTPSEHEAIAGGLARIQAELEEGSFPFRPELEDIHINIERRLVELIGPPGGKLHTGRSRNDQIALDERLYLKDICGGVR